uniref:Uncharacterized protein n=1 Tax=Rousettus aegyptiacus TaxID=9407 RepID=A0A7J8ILC7_ROUAE|nr:hypothetical protein HJG63_010627 [Rousettus aegyptiacus]
MALLVGIVLAVFTCRNKKSGEENVSSRVRRWPGKPRGSADMGAHYQVTPNPALHADILSPWASRELGVLQGVPACLRGAGRRSSRHSATRVSAPRVSGWLAVYLALERKLASACLAMEVLNPLRCCFC